LTQFERVELCDFRDKVYFSPKQSSDGDNLDDHEGYYNVKQGDHLLYRFEVDRVLGKGSFAQVVAGKDHKTGLNVAIKINRNTEIDHKFAEAEASLLKQLMQEDPLD